MRKARALAGALAMMSHLLAGAAAAGGPSYFDYARVLRVDPIREAVAVPVKEGRYRVSRRAPRADEPMAGDVRTAAPGTPIGEEMRHRGRTLDMRRCRRVRTYERRDRIVAYRVRYAYDGDVFVRRMNEHPGERVRVRVTLDPW